MQTSAVAIIWSHLPRCPFALTHIACRSASVWPNKNPHSNVHTAQVVREGQWWRTVTASFSHISLIHLGFNMISVRYAAAAAAISIDAWACMRSRLTCCLRPRRADMAAQDGRENAGRYRLPAPHIHVPHPLNPSPAGPSTCVVVSPSRAHPLLLAPHHALSFSTSPRAHARPLCALLLLRFSFCSCSLCSKAVSRLNPKP
jgi:hypothetical protein